MCLVRGERRGRVAVFMDMHNIFYAAQALGLKIDYLKLRDYLARGAQQLRSLAYIAEDRENERGQGFITWLRNNRFYVVSKPLRRFLNGKAKGNFDVELAVDMLGLAPEIERAVLVSGDGDFTRLVEAVQDRGVRVTVAAFRDSVAWSLVSAADEFVALDDALDQIRLADGWPDPDDDDLIELAA